MPNTYTNSQFRENSFGSKLWFCGFTDEQGDYQEQLTFYGTEQRAKDNLNAGTAP